MKKRYSFIIFLWMILFSLPFMNYRLAFLYSSFESDNPSISINKIQVSSSFNAGNYIGLGQNRINNSLTGSNVTVAIIDSGINANHDVFTNDGSINWTNRILEFYDIIEKKSMLPFDDHGHGTWAASILGGNSTEYTGVASNVSFVILRIFDKSGETNISIFIEAVNWILDHKDTFNIKIVSMSFGAKPEQQNLNDISKLQQASADLVDEGILVVAAAGNDGNPLIPYGDGTINAPASDKKVLAVGGVDYLGNMYPNSAKGPSFEDTIKPDVCAPAIGILGADKDYSNDYSYRTGTSGATPFVAGLAALMLEHSPTLNPLQLKNIISLSSFRTTRPLTIKDNIQGWGVIQGYAALEALSPPILFNSTTSIVTDLNENKTVLCLPITLFPGYLYFELARLNNTTAEMYLFSKEGDQNGEPVLLAHTINPLSIKDPEKTMGIYNEQCSDFYLVVKLTQENSGSFLIRMVLEYRNSIIVVYLGISIFSLLYVGNLSKKFKNLNK